MINTASHKPLLTIFSLMLLSIFTSPLHACTGTGIGNATSFYAATTDETTVEIEFCLGVTDLFGLPSDFRITFDGISAVPSIDANASLLSATYNFNEDAASTGFFCNCFDNLIGSAPAILSNTDTWSATANPGELFYDISRSNSSLTNECQIDCVNGQPIAASGGNVNYMTSISACFVITTKFPGDVEGSLAGITLSGAENGVCDDELEMSFGLSGSLPVELGSFDGTLKENSVLINWTTLAEDNVYKYVVERSANGFSDFEAVGTVGVRGNSQGIKKYNFEDTTPIAKGFYRLKTVDIDGAISYSHIILIEKAIKDLNLTNIYPNPVEDQTTIIYETKANADVHFQVFDVNGRLRSDQTIEALNGFNKIDFDFKEYQEGIYFIVLESGTEKIVKRITKF